MSYNLRQIDPDRRTGLYADPRDEEPPARPRRILQAGAALLVMGLFAGGLWLAYVEGMRHSAIAGDNVDVPLIRADTRPMKVKPANPGGMAIPDRDLLIYGEGHPTIEHLLPPPETPMDRPAPPPPPSPPPAPAGLQAATNAPPAGLAAAAALAPEQQAGASTANPSSAPAKPAEARTAPAQAGGLRLQLGAVRSEDVAREEWSRIKRRNADLLGRLSAVAIRADLGDKGVYYRIQAGPVADPAAADRICGELRQRHLGCIVVR
jgi:cell division septation protein DedD